MKRIILLILILCAVSTLTAQAPEVQSKNVMTYDAGYFSLTGTQEVVVYFIFPTSELGDYRRFQPSYELPTWEEAQSEYKQYETSGDGSVSVIIDTVSNQDTDSLYSYIRPLFVNPTKQLWFEADNETTYIDWDSATPQCQSTIDYLDWTHGDEYMAVLSNELWAAQGFALHIGQVCKSATSVHNVYWTITH